MIDKGDSVYIPGSEIARLCDLKTAPKGRQSNRGRWRDRLNTDDDEFA
jgi:hypothetical protein